MFHVTVYSKPNCVQCTATYRALNKHGLTYAVVNLAAPENADTLAWVTDGLGCTQAPVVVVDGDPAHRWSGFRPDGIQHLASIG